MQVEVLTDEQWTKLERGASDFHVTIWSIMRFTACRSCEARWLTVGNVYKDDGELRASIYFPAEIRKGKKDDLSVPINDRLLRYLKAYNHPKQGYLFPSPRNPDKPISYEALIKYLSKRARICGLGDLKIGTHSGRRSCLTNLAKSGIALPIIQRVSGHRNLASLQRYLAVTAEDVSEALKVL